MLRRSTLAGGTALAAALLALPAAAQTRYGPYYSPSGVVSVTAVKYTDPCALELLITSADNDLHRVEIEYSITGMFSNGAGFNAREWTSRSNKETIDVGPTSPSGRRSLSKSAWMMNLNCSYLENGAIRKQLNWEPFGFRVTEKNLSEARRQHDEELRRQKQAKIDERERKKRELEERKRRSDQMIADLKRKMEQEDQRRFEDYSRSMRDYCLARDKKDIAFCEENKRRILENKAREDARLREQRLAEERERLWKIESDRISAEYERRGELYHTDPCRLYELERDQPVTQITTTNPQFRAAQEGQRKQALAAHEKNCNDWKAQQGGGGSMAAPMQTQQAPAAPVAAPQQAAQSSTSLRSELIRQQKQREQDQANRDAQQILLDAASKAGTMRDENAELQRLLNNMK